MAHKNTNETYIMTYDENPFVRIKRDMKVPLTIGLSFGAALQGLKHGTLDTPATFGRMIHTAYPICGIAFLYSSTSFVAAQLRKKDDVMNNIIGVLSTTPVFRKFLPLGATITSVAFATAFVSVLKLLSFEDFTDEILHERLNYNVDGSSMDWYIWSQNKPPSEPYVKHWGNTYFSFPSTK